MNPAFKIEVIDNASGTKNSLDFRKVDKKNIAEDIKRSGQLVPIQLPPNGGSLPEIRISKNNDEYLEIASLTFDIGSVQ